MSGRPTLPPDIEHRPEVRGAAVPTPGLSDALDEERAASMADEGGRSGAYFERQEPLLLISPWYRHARPWLAIGAVSLTLGLGAWGLFALQRRSVRRRVSPSRLPGFAGPRRPRMR
jgi:hypothetical protein